MNTTTSQPDYSNYDRKKNQENIERMSSDTLSLSGIGRHAFNVFQRYFSIMSFLIASATGGIIWNLHQIRGVTINRNIEKSYREC